MIQNKIKKLNSAFTLVETLVAVSIFSLAVLALMVVLSDSVTSTSYAKKKIIAVYLAQEGIEYFRNIRDTYVLYQAANANGWDEFRLKVEACNVAGSDGCYFDDQGLDFLETDQPITNILVNECTGDCPYLLHDGVTGKYNYTVGESTDFSRKMLITNITDDEIRILSTVSWTQGSGEYQISFSENLFNWTK